MLSGRTAGRARPRSGLALLAKLASSADTQIVLDAIGLLRRELELDTCLLMLASSHSLADLGDVTWLGDRRGG